MNKRGAVNEVLFFMFCMFLNGQQDSRNNNECVIPAHFKDF